MLFRSALVFPACSGEMGAALARRDYGETVDDMAQNFPWWFAGNFQKFAAHWNDMPVDAHSILALNAPRPVFLTAGTQDQWADPRGQFLALAAAGPVWRLIGGIAIFALLAYAASQTGGHAAQAQPQAQIQSTGMAMWDLNDLFPGPEAWQDEYNRTKADAEMLVHYRGTLGSGARAMLNALNAISLVNKRVSRL